jgi:4-hydroxy-3-polyprenylbenzoate decarboxylase
LFYYDDATDPNIPVEADAMVIVPCRMDSLSSMIHGSCQNILQKAADEILKSKKKLILVTSEALFETLHLEIMVKLAFRGAIIMPQMPSFYHKPSSIDDIINHHTGRILDLMNIEHSMVKLWGETE